MPKNVTLAEKLAPMTMAEIDAMTDDEVVRLMRVHPEAAEPVWAIRQAAKAATNEYAEKVLAQSKPVPPTRLERYRQASRGGRPRLGDGESVQLRARIDTALADALVKIEAVTGKGRSQIVREALADYVKAHPDAGQSLKGAAVAATEGLKGAASAATKGIKSAASGDRKRASGKR